MERMTPDTTDFNSLSKKQLVELVIAKYNDCFRLEEENKKLKKYYDRDKEELMESCYSLAKENDKLKSDLMEDMKEITKLEKENKKLNENYKVLGILNDEIRRVNESLREDNKKLKEDVDYFRQCYLDLKKLCEKEGFMLSDEEVAKMLDLDKIK